MDLQAKKVALRKIPHGVYIIGVKQGKQLNAFTATWLTQASFTPPLVAMGVKKDSGSFEMIKSDRVFTVNLLGKEQKPVAEHFVRPATVVGEKLKEVQDTYYALVFALADREVKKQSLELANRQIEITEVMVRTGALARVEITTAKSGQAGRNADLVTADAAVVAAEDERAVGVGVHRYPLLDAAAGGSHLRWFA